MPRYRYEPRGFPMAGDDTVSAPVLEPQCNARPAKQKQSEQSGASRSAVENRRCRAALSLVRRPVAAARLRHG